MNKNNTIIMIVIINIFCLLSISSFAFAISIPVGEVDLAEGSVWVLHMDQKASIILKKGDNVYALDKVTTDDKSKVKITFINKSSIYLGENAHLTISKILYMPDKSLSKTFLNLYKGKIRAIVEKFTNPDSKFEIETKTAIAGVAGTEEIVSAYEDTETKKDITRVICRNGRISVRSSDEKKPEIIFLEPLEQSWVLDGESPREKIKIAIEELEELIQTISIPSGEEAENKGAVSTQKTGKDQKTDDSKKSEQNLKDKQGEQPVGEGQEAQSEEQDQDKSPEEQEQTGQIDEQEDAGQLDEQEQVEHLGDEDQVEDFDEKDQAEGLDEDRELKDIHQETEGMQESFDDLPAVQTPDNLMQNIEGGIESNIEGDIESNIEDIEGNIEDIEKEIEDVHSTIPTIEDTLPAPPGAPTW